MSLTNLSKVTTSGIATGTSLIISNVNSSGVVTASTVQIGSATTIHTTGIDLGSGNITSHNINSTGIITSTSFVGPVTGNITGDLTGNVSSSGANTLGSLTVTNDATVGGALTVTGDLTVNGTTTTIDTAVTAVDSLAIDGNATVGGSVGIGTDNPVRSLDIQSPINENIPLVIRSGPNQTNGFIAIKDPNTTADFNNRIGSEGDNLLFWSNGGERLRITSGGNIGIGTDNPIKTLQIGSISGNFQYTSTNALGIVSSQNPGISVRNTGNNSEFDLEVSNSAAGMRMGSSTSHNLNLMTANQSRLIITSGGSVGINTDIPRGSLHVYSDETGELPATSHALVISRASSASNRLLLGVDENSGYGVISSVDPGTAWTNTTINPAGGNVGIGLTNPSAKLHISSGGATQMLISNKSVSMSDGDTIGTIDFTAGTSFTTNARVAGLVEGTSEAGGDLIFETRQDGGSLTEKVRINSIGNVGIGTQIPGANLHIESSAYPTIKIQNTSDASGFPVYQIIDRRTNGRSFNIEQGRYSGTFTVRDNTAGSDRISVDSSGNIGIGLTNPSARLHVYGGTNDTPAYFDTGNTNGAHIRFLQGGSVRHFLGCGGGISLGDKDDLTMRAYDNIIFATGNSSTRRATIRSGGEFIVGKGTGASGLLHVQHDEITAAAPSLGWPHYYAENDDNARIALHLETAGNTSNSSTAGHGASVVLRMGQYYDSRAVITTLAAGGSSPSDQGTGHGKDLLIKGGRSDNANGKYGGRLFLNGGSGYNSNAYDTNYGHCVIQGLGGRTGVGILTPTSKLEVHESLSSSGATGAAIFVVSNERVNTGSSAAAIRFRTNEITGTNQYTRAQISAEYDDTNNNNGRLMFATADTNGNLQERLRINGAGDLSLGGNSNNRVKNEYYGSVIVTGTNSGTEQFAFRIQGTSYVSGGHLTVYGTSGNVVVAAQFTFIVNHSGDITIQSYSGAYTQCALKIITDNNDRGDIYLRREAGYASGSTTLRYKFIPFGGTGYYTTAGNYVNSSLEHVTVSGSFNLTATGGGAANVNAGGTKNFLIDHPLVGLSTTTRLAHAAIEGPECNTMYRGKVDLVDGTATVNIDTNSRMTEGTFEALNQNVQCYTTNETGWTAVKGSVSGNLLTIIAQDSTCTDTVSWMVVGERKDQNVINSRMTDSEGRLITEITGEYDPSQFPEYVEPVEETEESS